MLQDQQKFIQILGWVATFTAICMYVSYIPQIMNNLVDIKEIRFNLLLQQSTVYCGSFMDSNAKTIRLRRPMHLVFCLVPQHVSLHFNFTIILYKYLSKKTPLHVERCSIRFNFRNGTVLDRAEFRPQSMHPHRCRVHLNHLPDH